MQDRNYTSMLAELRNADAGSFAELVLRFIILTTGFSFIAFWHKDMNVVYWYAFYGTLHFFYIQALLKHAEPVSLTTYRSFVFVGVVAILSLDFMILYLWQTGDPICRFGAVGLLIGHGMFSLARHRKLRDLLIADGLSISAHDRSIDSRRRPRLQQYNDSGVGASGTLRAFKRPVRAA